MDVSLKGKLVDCVNTKSKDGNKDYFSLIIYSNGITYRVGVNFDMYQHYQNFLNDDIELTNVSIWVEGKYSLYIKG